MRLKHALFWFLIYGLVHASNANFLDHRTAARLPRGLERRAGLDDVLGWTGGGQSEQGGQSGQSGQAQDAPDSSQDPAPTKTSDGNGKPSILDVLPLPTETNSKKDAMTAPLPAHTVIGTPPPPPSATPKSTTSQKPSSTASSSSTYPTSTPGYAAATSGSDGGTSQWKIIGVAVIAFSAVAAILLLAVFFDQWWRFFKDFMGRRRAKGQVEEIVPDWEKASWEVRFGDDRHRYPSFSSVPDKSLTNGLTRERSIRSDSQWKERAAEAIQRSPLSVSSGQPPSPRSFNRLPRSPTDAYMQNYNQPAYPNPFEPPRPRSPAPHDVYGGME